MFENNTMIVHGIAGIALGCLLLVVFHKVCAFVKRRISGRRF